MRKLICLITLLTLAGFAAAAPPAGVPRQSPEFIIAEPSGKTILLSSLKGKVVVMEFLFIQSDHCVRVAKTLNKLNSELGALGFQPVGVVFDPPNGGSASGQLIPALTNYLKLTYPVGYATKSEVDRYLGRTGKEILNIPQVIVIDRAGMIRAASGGAGGNPKLEDADSLRAMIGALLKEEAGGGKTARLGQVLPRLSTDVAGTHGSNSNALPRASRSVVARGGVPEMEAVPIVPAPPIPDREFRSSARGMLASNGRANTAHHPHYP
ncbi:MAG TPA: TlpA disulfide reductase family protein [Thermoanaerobaculia bacterium]|nr:TlpA disulfide reductase family protein [Thermoanaerobaculia bacterium]